MEACIHNLTGWGMLHIQGAGAGRQGGVSIHDEDHQDGGAVLLASGDTAPIGGWQLHAAAPTGTTKFQVFGSMVQWTRNIAMYLRVWRGTRTISQARLPLGDRSVVFGHGRAIAADAVPHAGKQLPQIRYLGLRSEHFHNLSDLVAAGIVRSSVLGAAGMPCA